MVLIGLSYIVALVGGILIAEIIRRIYNGSKESEDKPLCKHRWTVNDQEEDRLQKLCTKCGDTEWVEISDESD